MASLENKVVSEKEHIMVCLSASASNPEVIRHAARIASSFEGKFTAFYVETVPEKEMVPEEKKRLQENIRVAEQYGAKIIVSYGNDVAEQVAEYVKVAKVTEIVMGKTYKGKFPFLKKDSVSERLLKIAPKLKILLIPDPLEHERHAEWIKWKKKQSIREVPSQVSRDLLILLFFLSVSTGISCLFQQQNFSKDSFLLVYMMGGLLEAMFVRRKISSILYALGSIVLFNYIFVEPMMTLKVQDSKYIPTFIVMFVISIAVSTLMLQTRNIAKQAATKAYRTEILLETSQKLQQAKNMKEIAEKSANQLAKLLGCDVYCILGKPHPNMEKEEYFTSSPETEKLSEDEIAVACWTYENNKHAGATTNVLPGARCLYLTVRNGDKIFAIVGIGLNGKVLSSFEKSVMLAMLNESALAFEREELRLREQEIALSLQQERLRANLLRAVSHDLRTPLTGISGNADILMESYQDMKPDELKRIFQDIHEDAVWLINLVENLLSVTRIENGTMKLSIQPEMVEDILYAVMNQVKRHLGTHKFHVNQQDDMLMARMDAKLIIQVLTNLVDNAVKHTPEKSEINLNVYKKGKKVLFEVADNGDGIQDDQKKKIFRMFYSGEKSISDRKRCMGMGLPLCKSIVEAHGGEIIVEDNKPHGAVFRFELDAEEVTIG